MISGGGERISLEELTGWPWKAAQGGDRKAGGRGAVTSTTEIRYEV